MITIFKLYEYGARVGVFIFWSYTQLRPQVETNSCRRFYCFYIPFYYNVLIMYCIRSQFQYFEVNNTMSQYFAVIPWIHPIF